MSFAANAAASDIDAVLLDTTPADNATLASGISTSRKAALPSATVIAPAARSTATGSGAGGRVESCAADHAGQSRVTARYPARKETLHRKELRSAGLGSRLRPGA